MKKIENKEIEAYVRSCEIESTFWIPLYNEFKACLIGSYEGIAQYKNDLFSDGKFCMTFDEAKEIDRELEENY